MNNKIKVSLMRSFGTEQFSLTTEVEPTEVEANQAIFAKAVETQFIQVMNRQTAENRITAEASIERTAVLKAKEDAMKAEMVQVESTKKTLKQATQYGK
jgi:hypothetical protein